MYFLSVGPLQVISLYFYCLHLATGESWLSGLIFPYLLSSLLDLPVGVYWVFLTEFYDEIQIVFWKFVVSDELHQKHRWISDSDMLEFLPAHPMGFQRLQSNRVVQSLTFWQTLSCQCPGAGFPVCGVPAIHTWTTGTLDQLSRWDLKSRLILFSWDSSACSGS